MGAKETRVLYFIGGSNLPQLGRALSAVYIGRKWTWTAQVTDEPNPAGTLKRFGVHLKPLTHHGNLDETRFFGEGTVDGERFNYELIREGDNVVLKLTPLH